MSKGMSKREVELRAEIEALKGITPSHTEALKVAGNAGNAVHSKQTETDGKFLRLGVEKLRDTVHSQGIHMGISNITAAFMAHFSCDRDTAIARINACAVKVKNRDTGVITYGSGHVAIIPQARSGKAKRGHLRMYLAEEAPQGKANDGSEALKTMGL